MKPPVLDFRIRRFQESRFDSPIQLSYDPNDMITNYMDDSERILFPNTLLDLKSYMDRGEEVPSFEAAGPRDKIYYNPSNVTAAIVTCGGLCPGINDVIRGIAYSLKYQYKVKKVLGIQYGYKGLAERSQIEPIELTHEVVESIHNQGGTMLGSSRGPQDVGEMVDFMVKHEIKMLFAIGGDGTQRGALELVKEIDRRGLDISVVGLPKTIDNDVMYVTKSFGFETAYSTATQVLQSAHAEAEGAYNGVAIVKLMGRHSGFLSATASIASGDVNFLWVPEVPMDMDPPNGFLAALEKRLLKRHHALVVVAEGAGQELIEQEATKRDASGNVILSDIGEFLYERVKQYFHQRNIEANVKYIDPSYFVRSVKANASDSMFCLQLAHNAVHAAMTGRTGLIIGFWNNAFTHVPIEAAVSERKVIDPEEELWLSVLETTGQPNRMINR